MRADAEEPKQRVWVETNYSFERLQEDRFDRLVPEGQSSGSGSQLQILQDYDREEDKMITAEASGTQQWRIGSTGWCWRKWFSGSGSHPRILQDFDREEDKDDHC